MIYETCAKCGKMKVKQSWPGEQFNHTFDLCLCVEEPTPPPVVDTLKWEVCWQQDVRDLTAAVKDLVWEIKQLNLSILRK
jgi:hypothetical protein